MIASRKSSRAVRCAVYTRKSTDENLHLEFNSLDSQRSYAESYVESQQGEGWICLPDRYDDPGFSGATTDRPALQQLLSDIEAGKVDCVLVYRVDRLSRSLLDFGRLMEIFDKHEVSFVSVTQLINTATSAGRLMLHVLLSFAQYEREIIAERTRDKIAASRRQGRWTGGRPILGFDIDRSQRGGSRLVVNEEEVGQVRAIFDLYLEHGSLLKVVKELKRRGWRTKRWIAQNGKPQGGAEFNKCTLHQFLRNPLLIGKVTYRDEVYDGLHEGIVDLTVWDKVQQLLRRNGRSGSPDARNRYGALLRGLLRCGHCQCAMSHTYTKRGTKLYRYYSCNALTKGITESCSARTVPASEIEDFVIGQIRSIGRDPALAGEVISQLDSLRRERAEKLEHDRTTTMRELDRNHRALRDASDGGVLADLHEQIAITERRLAEMTQEAELIEHSSINNEQARAALARFDPLWESMNTSERCRLLELLIAQVEFDGEHVEIQFHDAGIATLLEGNEETVEQVA